MAQSRFCQTNGILFAADLDDEKSLFNCLDKIVEYIQALKVGNALLYTYGPNLITKLKNTYNIPVVADIKLTDVSHIATRVSSIFADSGADAILLSGVCGKTVFEDVVSKTSNECDVWVFSEFTNIDGLIDQKLADESIHLAIQSGAKGVQVPATRPHRIETVRAAVGENITIVSCGIGIQGGTIGSAIRAGANFEIIGRSIFSHPYPGKAAKEIKEIIDNEMKLSAGN